MVSTCSTSAVSSCTRANVPGLSEASGLGAEASNANVRVCVLTAGLMRDTVALNVRSGNASTLSRQRLSDLDPRRHALGNLGQ